ncbi:hypothetical protein E2C01_064111 [Portunus trituberculatus]|uniref:Uncharacterized protein n=1 Tax=Portunus trituberculatus TaxID=210409 RepID=A0A5B7HJG4_PORTR|nr:hypothetical protein [Portunus trituberculatus]
MQVHVNSLLGRLYEKGSETYPFYPLQLRCLCLTLLRRTLQTRESGHDFTPEVELRYQ